MPGDEAGFFYRTSAVAVALSGDIFVADGHGGASKCPHHQSSADGKFIKTCGQEGNRPPASSINRTESTEQDLAADLGPTV